MSAANADLRARLAAVDVSISEQWLGLKQLQDTREAIQRQLDHIVYPVLTLPNEITSEIFLQCLPPTPVFSEEEKDGPSSSDAPLLLLEICRTWRSIAISTPTLWVHLHLNLLEVYGDVEEIIAQWFRRAGSCPLSFSVRGYLGLDPLESDAIIATLVHHAHRLQSVALQLEQQQFKKFMGIGPFPLLDEIAIALPFMDDEDEPGGLWNLEIFSDAPRLGHLHFGQNAILSMFPLPCWELSKATCESLPIDDFLNLLEFAPTLLDFTCSVEPDPAIFNTELITHDTLQTLRLADNSSTHFLPLLRLPALQNLHLHIKDDMDDDAFQVFLTHSAASLGTFSASVPIRTIALGWFSIMSKLTDIQLVVSDETLLSGFLSSLASTNDSTFLPRLQSLTVVKRDFEFCALVNVFTARCTARDGVAQLQSFWGIYPGGVRMSMAASTRATLQGFINGGMQIHIGTEESNLI
ncbi:hypothetical protein B0H17DRAFT_1086017 [Mycena rosella]|uniref:F-box domain-containing protein n=1 Tax=Mycena rosella TaxID=1033263 RepID=A0AAD7CYK5_MYCRO|nr:hypothetical protein B0H17DRAFT_1086017 [Mycena rosella]